MIPITTTDAGMNVPFRASRKATYEEAITIRGNAIGILGNAQSPCKGGASAVT